jgi:hypothetical protein
VFSISAILGLDLYEDERLGRHGERFYWRGDAVYNLYRFVLTMRTDSPYQYLLLLGNKPLGPYDRRTLVGMRIKKLIDNEMRLRRSDGHEMSVAQLLADRFEMADAQSLKRQAIAPPASGIWPTFFIDCAGSLMKPGALGFIGKGELRFQGDLLRITANRKSGLMSTRSERVKLPIAAITSAQAASDMPEVLRLTIAAGQPFPEAGRNVPVRLILDDAESVKELLELINIG